MRSNDASARTSGLDLWHRELERRPPLPEDEQRRLGRAWRAGDREAGEKLVLHHLRFAYARARRAATRSRLPLDELVAVANLGLWEALERYDSDRGASFRTYAAYRVRDRLREAELELAHPVRLPVAPDRRLAVQRRGTVELDAPAGPETEAGASRADTALPAVEPEAERRARDAELRRALEEALAGLDAEERRALELGFGLDGREPRGHRAVARRMGVSVERAARLRERALGRLRRGPAGEKLAELWGVRGPSDPGLAGRAA